MGGDNFTITFNDFQYVGSGGMIGGSSGTDGTVEINWKITDQDGLTH